MRLRDIVKNFADDLQQPDEALGISTDAASPARLSNPQR
jgi:hypothetical protein